MIDKKFLKYRSYKIGTVICENDNPNRDLGIRTYGDGEDSEFNKLRSDLMMEVTPKIGDKFVEMWIPMNHAAAFQVGLAYMLNDNFGLYAENQKELLEFEQYFGKRLQNQVKKEMNIAKQVFNGEISPNEQTVLRVLNEQKSLYTRKNISFKAMGEIYALCRAFKNHIPAMKKYFQRF